MSVGKGKRFAVLTRDAYTCRYCGRSAPDVVLEVDHVEPRCEGGSDDLSNLVTACFDCNRGKKAHRNMQAVDVSETILRLQRGIEWLAVDGHNNWLQAHEYLAELEELRALLGDES